MLRGGGTLAMPLAIACCATRASAAWKTSGGESISATRAAARSASGDCVPSPCPRIAFFEPVLFSSESAALRRFSLAGVFHEYRFERSFRVAIEIPKVSARACSGIPSQARCSTSRQTASGKRRFCVVAVTVSFMPLSNTPNPGDGQSQERGGTGAATSLSGIWKSRAYVRRWYKHRYKRRPSTM